MKLISLILLCCLSGFAVNAQTLVDYAHPAMSTHDLQALIDRIHGQGGGKITFVKGEYHTGQLELKSGVELFLEEGAVVLGSTNPYD